MCCFRRVLMVLVGSVLVAGAPRVNADAFRCGSSLAQEGMTAEAIRERCGEPDLIRTREEPVFVKRQNGITEQIGITVTRFWYYDRGPTAYVARIAIRESIAEEIELLSIRDIEDLPADDPTE